MGGGLNAIDHIVVLMLENRSFDSMLGRLYPKTPGFNGLDGTEFNVDANGNRIAVWNTPGTDPSTMMIPSPDPGELFLDINTQLFGSPVVPNPAMPTMGGFARNYTNQTPPDGAPPASCDPRSVMHYFTPEQVPVISRLARQFAVCDQWHASAPCQTWPNRFFVHTSTANGYENNAPTHFPYKMPTIYGRLENAPHADGWRIYFHDMPQTLTLAELWKYPDHFRFYKEFTQDALNGTLPSYSFIEPRYFPDAELPNDEHPPHIVSVGEQLIADVYNNLRAGPAWAQTLLIITYDEHGGCYDHAPPPSATPPGPSATAPFNFDRFGVRVPAVVVSPYIVPGTVLRPPPGGTPFDHTSIIATVRQRFSLGPELSKRDAAAPDLGTVLTLDTPDNLGPEEVSALPYVASPAEIARARLEPLNGMQTALTRLAAHLPAFAAGDSIIAKVEAHVQTLLTSAEASLPAGTLDNRGNALHFIKGKPGGFFGGV
jgi:phospholipase C